MLAEAVLDRAIEGRRRRQGRRLESARQPRRRRRGAQPAQDAQILSEIADLHRSTIDELDEPVPDTIGDRGLVRPRQPAALDVGPLRAAREGRRRHVRQRVSGVGPGARARNRDQDSARSGARDDRLRERLLHEGRALARVRHPNVVNVLGVEAHEHRIGLCMEFVQGRDPGRPRAHARERSTRARRCRSREDVCRALAAVHGAAFVHRDVKARNIMRESAGRIVLMDFGTGGEARLLEAAGSGAHRRHAALHGAGSARGRAGLASQRRLQRRRAAVLSGDGRVSRSRAARLEELDDAHRSVGGGISPNFRTISRPRSFVSSRPRSTPTSTHDIRTPARCSRTPGSHLRRRPEHDDDRPEAAAVAMAVLGARRRDLDRRRLSELDGVQRGARPVGVRVGDAVAVAGVGTQGERAAAVPLDARLVRPRCGPRLQAAGRSDGVEGSRRRWQIEARSRPGARRHAEPRRRHRARRRASCCCPRPR